ncbi:hypothetical protein [Arthrobacter sp. JCM 19049]|uniref:hypothetical protein n=1 Tax=Arthrobacter sp. JCM 19049 TaxID=1460643 RepID=UPI000AD34F07|nr:hypothetical protein [Arthrobacter sp. JCM 19049]
MARGSVRRRRGRLQISRQLRRGEFVYLQRGEQITDPEELERIKALVIPPAWHDVQISASPSAKVLARGVDDAGRRQAIYHPRFGAAAKRRSSPSSVSSAKPCRRCANRWRRTWSGAEPAARRWSPA